MTFDSRKDKKETNEDPEVAIRGRTHSGDSANTLWAGDFPRDNNKGLKGSRKYRVTGEWSQVSKDSGGGTKDQKVGFSRELYTGKDFFVMGSWSEWERNVCEVDEKEEEKG